jgi:hypothetical protein
MRSIFGSTGCAVTGFGIEGSTATFAGIKVAGTGVNASGAGAAPLPDQYSTPQPSATPISKLKVMCRS